MTKTNEELHEAENTLAKLEHLLLGAPLFRAHAHDPLVLDNNSYSLFKETDEYTGELVWVFLDSEGYETRIGSLKVIKHLIDTAKDELKLRWGS